MLFPLLALWRLALFPVLSACPPIFPEKMVELVNENPALTGGIFLFNGRVEPGNIDLS